MMSQHLESGPETKVEPSLATDQPAAYVGGAETKVEALNPSDQFLAVPGAVADASTNDIETEGSDANSVIQPAYEGDIDDEGYASTEVSSYLSSILSSVRNGVEENGRIYPSFGKYTYGLPIDEQELDRIDLQHHKFTVLLNDQLYLAPISDSTFEDGDARVLDIGTGTGVWAIDMADKYPAAQIFGSDIAAIQPSFVPPNCIFEIEDLEDDWPYPQSSFDFIHGRELMTAIRDWPRLITQAYKTCRPGGWIELSTTIPEVLSDDNSLPPNSVFKEAGDVFIEMGEKTGVSIFAPRKWNEDMTQAGFVNVRDIVLKIPSGPWPRNKRQRNIGALERLSLMEGLEAYLTRGWTQVLGRSLTELAVFCMMAKKEMKDPKMHAYVQFHLTYGQKPEDAI